MLRTNSSNPVLSLVGVTKRFPLKGGRRVHAVENVSLEVLPGETVSLVGESGCGKSTLANLAMRLEEPDSGHVFVDGVETTGVSEKALRNIRGDIQMVFQDAFASLNPRVKIGDAISSSLRLHTALNAEEIQAKTYDLLERVGLEAEMSERYPHQFSGGQRQRICIARALAPAPKVIVADEATSALDVSVRANVLDLFYELQQDLSLAYLFVSHDLAIVERISHKVAVMYLGQIVEFGTRRQVFENPSHPYTQLLLSAVPVADPRQRKQSRNNEVRELRSPVWERGTAPSLVVHHEIEPGHWIAEGDGFR